MADNKNVGNSLLALSSAAVLAVYAAGYVRTRAAAERFAQQTEARVRPAFAVPATVTVKPAIPPAATPAASVEPTTPIASPKKPRRKKTVELIAPAAPKELTEPTEPKELREPKEPKEPERVTPPEPKEPSEPATAKPPRWKDGTYLGWGTSRHGDIQAQVVIEDGRIASATIAQCLTRYSCSVIAKLPPQVAERQSPEVDYVSGATQSTDAFYYAVVEALSKAK